MFSSPHSARNRTFLLLETRAPIPVAHMRPGCGLPHAGPPPALRGGCSVQSGTRRIPGPPGAFSACPFSGRPAKKSGYPHSAPCTGVHSAKKSGFLGLFERGHLKKESLRPAMNRELNGTRARSYRIRASEIDRPFGRASVKTIPPPWRPPRYAELGRGDAEQVMQLLPGRPRLFQNPEAKSSLPGR